MSSLTRWAKRLRGVVDVGHAAAHAGGEIVADVAEDHAPRPPVMYSQPLSPQPSTTATAPELRTAKRSPARPGREQLAGGRAVQAGVADDHVLARDHRARHQRADHDGAAREALADVVVGVAEHLELQALHREGAERLAGRAAQAHRDLAGRQLVHAVAPGDVRRQPGADRAVHVADIVGELHLLALDQRGLGVLDHLRVERIRHLVAALDREVARMAAGVDLARGSG